MPLPGGRIRVHVLVSLGHDSDVEVPLDMAAAGGGIKVSRFPDGRGQAGRIVEDESGDAVRYHLGH